MKRLPGQSTRNKNEVSQTIDVSKVLGVDVSGQPRLVQEVGQAIIDRIEKRTVEDNVDVGGKKFIGYDDDYVDSEEFAEFGKSRGDINLTLTGDMMDSLDFSQSGSTVKVQVEPGEAGKAFGNISGIRGKTKKSINPRDWFGATAKELKEIRNQFKEDIKALKDEERQGQVRETDFLTAALASNESPQDLFDSIFGSIFDGES